MNNTGGPELRTTDGNATTNVGSGSSDSEQAHSAPDEGPPGDSTKVVWVIVALAVLFILTVTYFVAQMPPKH